MRLVKPQTLARLQRPVALSNDPLSAGYAMGWGVFAADLVGLDARYGRVLNHLGSDGVWLSEVAAFPKVDFSIQILANATVDKDGNDLASGAFEEIKLRLFERFAPKFENTPRGSIQSATPLLVNPVAVPIERLRGRVANTDVFLAEFVS